MLNLFSINIVFVCLFIYLCSYVSLYLSLFFPSQLCPIVVCSSYFPVFLSFVVIRALKKTS